MPPDGRSRPGQAAPPNTTTDVESSTLHELPMAFSWSRCPVHPFLGVSVLVVNGFAPVCFPENGTPHPVDPAELRRSVTA